LKLAIAFKRRHPRAELRRIMLTMFWLGLLDQQFILRRMPADKFLTPIECTQKPVGSDNHQSFFVNDAGLKLRALKNLSRTL